MNRKNWFSSSQIKTDHDEIWSRERKYEEDQIYRERFHRREVDLLSVFVNVGLVYESFYHYESHLGWATVFLEKEEITCMAYSRYGRTSLQQSERNISGVRVTNEFVSRNSEQDYTNYLDRAIEEY